MTRFPLISSLRRRLPLPLALCALLASLSASHPQGPQPNTVLPDATASTWAKLEFKAREEFPPSLTNSFAVLGPDALALDPNAKLAVRVVDADGKPVPNALVQPWIEFTTERRPDAWPERKTNAQGLCSFLELEDALDACFHPEDRQSPLAGAVRRVGLQVALPRYGLMHAIKGAKSWTVGERVWLTSEPSPQAPVVLRLPPASWIDLRFNPVLDSDGNPVEDISIQIIGPFGCTGRKVDWLPVEPGADRLLLGPLALEQTLRIELVQRGTQTKLGELSVESPAEIGAIKRAKIKRTNQLSKSEPPPSHKPLDFDWGWLQLHPPITENDEPKRLLNGVVLDPLGAPIANAQIRGLLCNDLTAHPTDRGPWTLLDPVTTDEQGRFALTSIHFHSEHQHLWLEALHPDYERSGLRDAPLWNDPLRIELTRAYRAHLQVRTDAWMHGLDAPAIRIRSGDETMGFVNLSHLGPLGANASIAGFDGNKAGIQELTFAGLPTGPATLEVLLNPGAQSVSLDGSACFWQTSIEVQDDMDLGQLDLRGQFVKGSFRLQDGAGKPWRNAPIQLTGATPDGPIAITARTDSDGRLTLFLPASASGIPFSLGHAGRPTTEAVLLPPTAFQTPTGGQPFRPTVISLPID